MSRKEKYLIIDTETCNSLEQPLCYDIGYAICDNTGKIYTEKSYVVAEIFFNLKQAMQTAYYSEKIPQYFKEIEQGKRQVKSIITIFKQIRKDIKQYKIKNVGAYNMLFDKRALNNTIRYTTKSFIRWFFPFKIKYFCIWNMACQTLLSKTSYIKFCLQNNLINDKTQNVYTTAESCYKFITNSINFEESHTALEDVKIEIEIFVKCLKQHKKINKNINPFCWKIPQEKKKKVLDKIKKA